MQNAKNHHLCIEHSDCYLLLLLDLVQSKCIEKKVWLELKKIFSIECDTIIYIYKQFENHFNHKSLLNNADFEKLFRLMRSAFNGIKHKVAIVFSLPIVSHWINRMWKIGSLQCANKTEWTFLWILVLVHILNSFLLLVLLPSHLLQRLR